MSPYIKQDQRNFLDSGGKPSNAGQLNYFLSKIIIEFLGESPRYQNYNDVLGVLTAIQFELYRKKIADYEELKESENGSVY